MAHDKGYISIEDKSFNVIAEGEARNVLGNKIIHGLGVDYFYTGRRNRRYCTVIVVSRKAGE
jgi:hypothetical protein